jgi:hypothetical protein
MVKKASIMPLAWMGSLSVSISHYQFSKIGLVFGWKIVLNLLSSDLASGQFFLGAWLRKIDDSLICGGHMPASTRKQRVLVRAFSLSTKDCGNMASQSTMKISGFSMES